MNTQMRLRRQSLSVCMALCRLAVFASVLTTITCCSHAESFVTLFDNREDAVGSPRGDLPAGAKVVSSDRTMLARIDKTATKVQLRESKTSRSFDTLYKDSSNRPKALAFSADGTKLAVLYHSAGEVNTVRIFDTGKRRESSIVSFRGKAHFHEMIFYPDGRLALLLRWKWIGCIIDPASQQRIEGPASRVPLPNVRLINTLSKRRQFHSLTFSQDGATLAGASGNIVVLWNVQNGNERLTLTGHKDSIASVAFSPDGRYVASGGGDYPGTFEVLVCNADNGAPVSTLREPGSPATSLAFSPDGKMLATGTEGYHSGRVFIWDANMWELRKTLAHGDAVYAVAFSPDGKTLASGSREDSKKTVTLWDLETGQIKREFLEGDRVDSVVFSSDGKKLALHSRSLAGYTGLQLYDLGTGRLHPIRDLCGSDVKSIAFTPDSRIVVTGHPDNTVRLWEVQTAQLKRILAGGPENVTSVAFSLDGKMWASGCEDGAVRIWRVQQSPD